MSRTELRQCRTGKEFISFAKSRGAGVRNGHGSHQIVSRWGYSIPVPVHGNRDLPKGLRCAIIKQFIAVGISILVIGLPVILFGLAGS